VKKNTWIDQGKVAGTVNTGTAMFWFILLALAMAIILIDKKLGWLLPPRLYTWHMK